jgi:acyl dehydratase
VTIAAFPIEFGHIMMFARSIGDDNPAFNDPAKAEELPVGGIIAPPTFVQASAQFDSDYALRPKPGEPWLGSGKEPTGVAAEKGGGGFLHAEQHYEYHQPIRAGDVLTVRKEPGGTWQKEGRRGGKLTFSEGFTRYYNQHGQLVLTARGVGVRTERPADAA